MQKTALSRACRIGAVTTLVHNSVSIALTDGGAPSYTPHAIISEGPNAVQATLNRVAAVALPEPRLGPLSPLSPLSPE